MAEAYSANGILGGWAIGDLLGLVRPTTCILAHVKSVQAKLAEPKEIDTKPEFVGLVSEFTHALEDGTELIPGDWDDQAVARLNALVLSDAGSDALFGLWQWWHELPEPPSEQAVGQKMTELAKQIVDPA